MKRKHSLRLLGFLRGAEGRLLTPASVERELGIPRAEVPEVISRLLQSGFPVREHPGPRWSLDPGGPLLADEIRADLATKLIGKRVTVLAETTSTQDEARRAAGHNAPSGTVVFAETQTRGRGRFRREWRSEAGKDLTFSVVLRSPRHDVNPPLVTVTASVALCETIVEGLRLPARIKWPNDIVLGGRKAAGVLVERTHPKDSVPAFVLGIGINVNSTGGPAGAISLAQAAGREIDRVLLAREVLRSLDTWLDEVALGNVDLVAEYWRRYSGTLGRRITLVRDRKRFTGRVLDISPTVGLTIQTDDGLAMTLRGEQVTVEE